LTVWGGGSPGMGWAGSLELRNEQRKNEGLRAELRRKGTVIYSRRNGRGARRAEEVGAGAFRKTGTRGRMGRADRRRTGTRRRVAVCWVKPAVPRG
jgi:hypothetical protein